jgi:hypothetical protein
MCSFTFIIVNIFLVTTSESENIHCLFFNTAACHLSGKVRVCSHHQVRRTKGKYIHFNPYWVLQWSTEYSSEADLLPSYSREWKFDPFSLITGCLCKDSTKWGTSVSVEWFEPNTCAGCSCHCCVLCNIWESSSPCQGQTWWYTALLGSSYIWSSSSVLGCNIS